jgi:hypothetical protein
MTLTAVFWLGFGLPIWGEGRISSVKNVPRPIAPDLNHQATKSTKLIRSQKIRPFLVSLVTWWCDLLEQFRTNLSRVPSHLPSRSRRAPGIFSPPRRVSGTCPGALSDLGNNALFDSGLGHVFRGSSTYQNW